MGKPSKSNKSNKSNKIFKPSKKKLTKSTSKSTKSIINKLNTDQQEIDSVKSLLNEMKPDDKQPIFNVKQLEKDLQVDKENKLQKKIITEKMNEQLDLLGKIGL